MTQRKKRSIGKPPKDLEQKLTSYANSKELTHNETCHLIEEGWEYATGKYDDGGKIFRKPNENYMDSVEKLGMGLEPLTAW